MKKYLKLAVVCISMFALVVSMCACSDSEDGIVDNSPSEEEINNRYDEITRAKKFFTQIRKKMGTNLDIEDVAFDKEFLGKKGNLVSPYIESLIKSFYKLLKADPKLKTDKRYRAATGPFRVATLNNRVKADENAAPELSSIFSPVKLSPAKKAEYEAEQELEDLWEQEFDAISKSE